MFPLQIDCFYRTRDDQVVKVYFIHTPDHISKYPVRIVDADGNTDSVDYEGRFLNPGYAYDCGRDLVEGPLDLADFPERVARCSHLTDYATSPFCNFCGRLWVGQHNCT